MINLQTANIKDVCVRETRFLSSDDGWCSLIRIFANLLSEEDFYSIYKGTDGFKSSIETLADTLDEIGAGVSIFVDPRNDRSIILVMDSETILI